MKGYILGKEGKEGQGNYTLKAITVLPSLGNAMLLIV